MNENATEIEPLPEPEKPKPAFNSNSEVNLSERQRIAGELLGNIDWQSGTSGYCTCPGVEKHTTGNGRRDCRVTLDNAPVPTIHCVHNSCASVIETYNYRLRSLIAKGEYRFPATASAQFPISPRKASNSADADALSNQESAIELRPAPAPYIPPPLDLLPGKLQDYVHAAAGSLNVDVAYPFLPLLSSLGAAIGNSRSIILKRGYVQPPVIWTGVIGPTGSLKSPGLEAGWSPVLEHERELKRQNQHAHERFEEDYAQWKSENSKTRGPEPEKTMILTCLMDDLTIEVLSDRLAANPRGVLIAKDEISHWFASFDQYKNAKGSDVSRWLSLHTAVFLAVDRLKDNRHHRIWMPRVCITGGIQPKTLRRVLTEDFFERGLPARFLFAYPKTTQPRWSEATVSDELQNKVLELFANFWLLQPEHDEHGQARPKLLRLADEAKEIFVAFYNKCGAAAVETDEQEAAAWCKLSGYAARLALVGQLVRDPNAEIVTGDTMKAACELASWFGNEAVRIYASLVETQEQRETRKLIEFITSRGGSVTARDVITYYWPLKNQTEKAEAELNALVKARYGKWEPVPTTAKGGKPTQVFRLLHASASAKPTHLRGRTGGSADADAPNTQKNEASRESDKEAETLVGNESGVVRL